MKNVRFPNTNQAKVRPEPTLTVRLSITAGSRACLIKPDQRVELQKVTQQVSSGTWIRSSRHHPALFLRYRTHTKAPEGQVCLHTGSVLMLASSIKAVFLPPHALLPSHWRVHLHRGSADVCLPVRGRERQPGVTHLIAQADCGLFLAPP